MNALAGLLLACAAAALDSAQLAPTEAVASRPAAASADGTAMAAGAARAWLRVEGSVGAVGEPLRCAIRVQHPAGAHPELSGLAALEPGFALLAQRERVEPVPAGSASGAAARLTILELELLPLEPGPLALPALRIAWRGQPDAAELAVELDAHSAGLVIAPALEPGENAPRPLAGARPPPALPPGPAYGAIALGAAVCAAGALFAFARLRAARARAAAAPPSALERLDALQRSRAQPGSSAAELAHALARLLREECERRLAAAAASELGELGAAARPRLAALADEEWVLALPAEPERDRIAALLARLSGIRYAGAQPTDWAWEELFAAARELLAAPAAATAAEELRA